MPIGLVAPCAATIVVVAVAVALTRLWVNDTASRALRELRALGIRAGHSYKLGGAWTIHAARDRRNLMWAVLSAVAWLGSVVSLHLAWQ